MIMGVVLSSQLGYQNASLIRIDELITSLFYNSHSGNIDEFMILLSLYGREIVWSAVIVFLGVFAGWRGKKVAVIIIISFLILMPLNTLLKNFFERPRPEVERHEIDLPLKTDSGYPSGHASIVSSGAMVLMILYRRERELLFSSILTIEAALVCLSRIYVGDHYFFDLIGGALLGSGISLLTISFSNYIDPIINGIRKYLQKSK
jgi:membrane-associated phospholipid phosphatase